MEARSAFVSTVTMTTLLPWLLLLLQTGSGDGVVFGVSSGGSSGRFVYLFLFLRKVGRFLHPQILGCLSVLPVASAALDCFFRRWGFSGGGGIYLLFCVSVLGLPKVVQWIICV